MQLEPPGELLKVCLSRALILDQLKQNLKAHQVQMVSRATVIKAGVRRFWLHPRSEPSFLLLEMEMIQCNEVLRFLIGNA